MASSPTGGAHRLRALRFVEPALAILALLAIGAALWKLHATTTGLAVTAVTVGETPVTVFRPATAAPAPVVLIAHGFAGSQQLMQSFATTFARNGYIAVTFDFPGHGRNPEPLRGSITREDGATRTLLGTMAQVAAFARGLGDGRLAVLGHSMASDIVVRFADSDPGVTATIAVSMFSPAVTPAAPRNLLVIVGGWEGALKREALRAVAQVAEAEARPGVTYEDVLSGSSRRAAFSRHVEHIGVLYSRDSMREALAWLDASFDVSRAAAPYLDGRGPWILLLITGLVILARPLSVLLPAVADAPVGAALGWRSIWPLLAAPALATPLLLRVLPTHFLPVLVGDYLAAHFAVYGLITAACLLARRRRRQAPRPRRVSRAALALAALAVTAYWLVGISLPLDTYVTSFVPGSGRLVLILAMLVGTLAFFLSDEWLTRGEGAARGAYVVSKLAFLASLAAAVALDFERLFFLILIVPVIVLFFLVYGLFSTWAYRRTRHPFVAGLANALAFAWAIGVTFPLLAG